ncbi:MAG TPA: cysteine desulfurase-like protein [Candidatus Krumholzibacteria bacterium]|nr:cysteine desulfurase-like protein [Candidatus Krumholzibacteria bacterium]
MPGSKESASRPAVEPVGAIRAHFPALGRVHAGHPVAYFDGPGGTQVPRAVTDAVTDYLLNHNGNTHWSFPTSIETDAIVAAARVTFADFFHCAADEVVFGANMTTLTFHVARALAMQWKPGDEIVVTELDHHANVAPWRRLERERGLTLRTARMSPDSGTLDGEDLARAIGPRTRLVAVGAASNALGTVSDVARVSALARAAGALTFVDAVHYAPHALPDVAALGCDFLACSAYKFYGPHAGVMFGRRDLLASLDVPRLAPAPGNAPERMETGTGNFEGIAGAAAAVDFLASLAAGSTRRERLAAVFEVLHVRGSELVARAWEGLAAIPGVTLYGPRPGAPRTPTVAFTVRGVASADVTARLVRRAVFASHGHFYAPTVVERLGVRDGLVRAGCACYTTTEEIDRLVDGVRLIARG